MNGKIAPSMMCADIGKLTETLELFEKNGIEYLHIDVMDGVFVKNFTLGTDYCKNLRKMTKIPLDIHLMIEDPESKLDWFDFGEGDIVSIHVESTRHLHKAIAAVQARGAKAFVAIIPGTPLSALDAVIDIVDGVLVMTVNPGFAGQKLIPATLDKIAQLRKAHPALTIECDGNVSFPNARKMSDCGADIFVAGTSAVFTKDFSVLEGIQKLRAAIE
jgi:ribulose-phosphate 3-epimerase